VVRVVGREERHALTVGQNPAATHEAALNKPDL
jgi:hypothetical protein